MKAATEAATATEEGKAGCHSLLSMAVFFFLQTSWYLFEVVVVTSGNLVAMQRDESTVEFLALAIIRALHGCMARNGMFDGAVPQKPCGGV